MIEKPLFWLAAGGAAAAATAVGVLLLRERTSGVSTQSSLPGGVGPPQYGEAVRVATAIPSGWRRATSAEVSVLPELGSHASALVNSSGFTSMQYGTLTPFTASDGRTYATLVEQHFHVPGGPTKPWGLHHGVTLLSKADVLALADEWSDVR